MDWAYPGCFVPATRLRSPPPNHHLYIGQETLKFKSSASAKVWQAKGCFSAVCHGKSGLESAHLSQGSSGPSTTQTASTVSSDGLVIFVRFVICDIVQVLLELIKDYHSWVQLYLILYSTAVSVWSCELCAVVFYNLMRCCTVTVERPCFCQQLFISQVWNWNWKLLRMWLIWCVGLTGTWGKEASHVSGKRSTTALPPQPKFFIWRTQKVQIQLFDSFVVVEIIWKFFEVMYLMDKF